MIAPELHKKVAALDKDRHRGLRMRGNPPPHTALRGLNAMFVTGAEFGDAAKEYPLLFLHAGQDDQGRAQVAPVAVFGLSKGENLMLDGERWDAHYLPAIARAYPFTLGKVADGRYAVCVDESWVGLGPDEGERLFTEAGEPTPYLVQLRQFVEQIEVEVERTRLVGVLLMELKLLREMRFDATLTDGRKITVDGFLSVDEERLAKLTDAEIVDLQRKGVLGLLHAHQISLGNMRRLTERRLALDAQAVPANLA